ncbi:MAG: hypothetical protein HYV95_10275 [Opitutae bacterium]|nr:hypothetical protein [Opitutae bacterium]
MDEHILSREATIEFRPFLWLFADAAYYADLAGDKNIEREFRASHARCSILMTVFAVEGALNSALIARFSSKRLFRRIERFPFPEKTEFVAHTFGAQAKIDSNAGFLLDMEELVDVRNQQVHPKNTRKKMVGGKDAQGKPSYRNPKPGFSPRLRIPDSPSEWDHDTAVTAIRVADRFLSQFFTDICLLKEADKTTIFLSGLEGDGWTATIHEQHAEKQLQKSRAGLKLGLQYMPDSFLNMQHLPEGN